VRSPTHVGCLRVVQNVEEHVAEQLELALEEERYLAVGNAGEELLPREQISFGMAPIGTDERTQAAKNVAGLH
jgi:hypothetical protein